MSPLRETYRSLGWQTELVVDRLAASPALTTELVDAARYGIVTSDIWRPRPRSAGGGSQPCVWPRSL
jgi:hypothetical protein